MNSKRQLSRDAYTVGLITALSKELAAARAVLDEEHDKPDDFERHPTDKNHYIWGLIGAHNVIIASLPSGIYGLVAAANTSSQLLSSFPNIRFGLMVGIGAGIPRDGFDIRLGDVVVSKPEGQSPGVVQYDLGKIQKGGHFQPVGFLASPPDILLTCLAKLESEHIIKGSSRTPEILLEMLQRYPALAKPTNNGIPYVHQGMHNDRLFLASAQHVEAPTNQAMSTQQNQSVDSVSQNTLPFLYWALAWAKWLIWFLFVSPWHVAFSTPPISAASAGTVEMETTAKPEVCTLCDFSKEIQRKRRSSSDPAIHYGLIASGNSVIKDGISRDKILQRTDPKCICFEMEAAGLMRTFPCLVVRGICDYADTHKNDRWQNYAAAAAAAYAKELLLQVESRDVLQSPNLKPIIEKCTMSDMGCLVSHDVSQLASNMQETDKAVRRMEGNLISRDIEIWLDAPDSNNVQEMNLRQRHEGTGQWVLENEVYLSWKTNEISSLCLFGKPGCGKTILSSTIIKDLGETDVISKGLVYFYFSFTDARRQALSGVIRSFIKQLCSKSESAYNDLSLSYLSHKKNLQSLETESLSELFKRMAKQAGNIWIVLDALDECQTPSGESNVPQLLEWIESLVSSKINVRLIVTSRPENQIKEYLGRHTNHRILLHSDAVATDIESYVSMMVRQDDGLKRWRSSAAIQDEIQERLVKGANGTFRWVSCQLDELKYCREINTLREVLGSLPKTLEDTYEAMVGRIPSTQKELVMRLLHLLAFSSEPLTIEAAVDALGVQFDRCPRFSIEFRMPVPEEVILYCSSLVVISDEDLGYVEDYYGNRGSQRLTLAHATVKDYLESPKAQRSIPRCMGRGSIAKVCVAYLLELEHSEIIRPVTQLSPLSNDRFHSIWRNACQLQHEYPFAGYAARNWTEHVSEAKIEDISSLVLQLFTSPSLYEICYYFWEQRRSNHETYGLRLSNDDNTPPPALSYAAQLGLDWVVNTLLEEQPSTVKDLHDSLLLATAHGHVQTVNVLLHHGASVNAKALRYAGSRGDISLLSLLLEKVTGPDSGIYKGALYAATNGGHEELVAMLLQRVPTSDADMICAESFIAAAEKGYMNIVEMLINKGVSINTYIYGTAIYHAAANRHEHIAEFLFAKGADVKIKCWTPDRNVLYAASLHGFHRIVQRILRSVDDATFYEATLAVACGQGHHQLVDLLMKKSPDDWFCNAGLIYASRAGDIQLVEEMIKRKADVRATLQSGENALWHSVNNNHLHVVRRLLDYNADPNSSSRTGETALDTACSEGREEVAKVLLQRGATPNTPILNGEGNALQRASRSGCVGIVQALLDHGAKVDATGPLCLSEARRKGYDKIVELLVEAGVADWRQQALQKSKKTAKPLLGEKP